MVKLIHMITRPQLLIKRQRSNSTLCLRHQTEKELKALSSITQHMRRAKRTTFTSIWPMAVLNRKERQGQTKSGRTMTVVINHNRSTAIEPLVTEISPCWLSNLRKHKLQVYTCFQNVLSFVEKINIRCYILVPGRIVESMMVFRPRQRNLGQVFRVFSLMQGSAEHETNNLKMSLRFPCWRLNTIFDYFFSHIILFFIAQQENEAAIFSCLPKNTKIQHAKL